MAGRLTLHHLALFDAVCAQGGVTAAARALHVSQPSVSQAVRDLEEYFGVTLFDRVARRMELTDEGRRLRACARTVLDGMTDLERTMVDGGPGSLRIASSITAGTRYLPQVLATLTRELPGLELAVRVEDSENVEAAVVNGEVDLGLIEGLLHHEGLISQVFARDRLVVVAAAGSAPARITANELVERPLVLREKGSGVRELFDAALRERGLMAHPIVETVSTEAAKAAVEAGLGYAVLPEALVERELEEGRLARVTVAGLTLERELCVIRHARKSVTRSMERFLALLGVEADA